MLGREESAGHRFLEFTGPQGGMRPLRESMIRNWNRWRWRGWFQRMDGRDEVDTVDLLQAVTLGGLVSRRGTEGVGIAGARAAGFKNEGRKGRKGRKGLGLLTLARLASNC